MPSRTGGVSQGVSLHMFCLGPFFRRRLLLLTNLVLHFHVAYTILGLCFFLLFFSFFPGFYSTRLLFSFFYLDFPIPFEQPPVVPKSQVKTSPPFVLFFSICVLSFYTFLSLFLFYRYPIYLAREAKEAKRQRLSPESFQIPELGDVRQRPPTPRSSKDPPRKIVGCRGPVAIPPQLQLLVAGPIQSPTCIPYLLTASPSIPRRSPRGLAAVIRHHSQLPPPPCSPRALPPGAWRNRRAPRRVRAKSSSKQSNKKKTKKTRGPERAIRSTHTHFPIVTS